MRSQRLKFWKNQIFGMSINEKIALLNLILGSIDEKSILETNQSYKKITNPDCKFGKHDFKEWEERYYSLTEKEYHMENEEFQEKNSYWVRECKNCKYSETTNVEPESLKKSRESETMSYRVGKLKDDLLELNRMREEENEKENKK